MRLLGGRLTWNGFTPSPAGLALGLALGAVLALIGAHEFNIKAITYIPESAMLANEHDDFAHAAYALRAFNQRASSPSIVFLGGSAMREAVPDLNLLHRTFPAFRVTVLATSAQSMSQTLTLVKALRLDAQANLVIHVSPSRVFGEDPDGDAPNGYGHLPFVSTFTNAGIPQSLAFQLRAFADDRFWITHKLGSKIFYFLNHPLAPRNRITYRPHVYDEMSGSEPKDSLMELYRAMIWTAAHLPRNMEACHPLLQILAIARAVHCRVLLVDLPEDPAAVAADSLIAGEYARALSPFRKAGVAYLDLRPTGGITDNFFDLHHLRSPTIRLATVRRIVQALPQ